MYQQNLGCQRMRSKGYEHKTLYLLNYIGRSRTPANCGEQRLVGTATTTVDAMPLH
jgi:hypothetical protein